MTRRIAQLGFGLFFYGFAIALMIRAEIGVAPWDVLGQGVSLSTGLPFGLVTNIVGLIVLLLWIPIRQKPGIGTVFNVALVGPSAQVGPRLRGSACAFLFSSLACCYSESPPGSTSGHALGPDHAMA